MTATLRKLLTVFEIAFVICFGLVNESRGQTQSLTAFYTAPVVSMAPMWIAKAAGFFKKQGLEVKLLFMLLVHWGRQRSWRAKSMGVSSADLLRYARLREHRRA